jgi:hypothetical protein
MLKHLWWTLGLLLCPLPVQANGSGAVTTAWLGLSATSFNYEEFDDTGVSLDREEGWLPGVQAGLARDYGRWFLETTLNWSSGQVDYTSPAASSTTDEDIGNLEMIGGIPLHFTGRQRISVVAGAGYREWRRDIRPTPAASGLDETYRWGYAVVGLRGERSLDAGNRVVVDLQLTRTIHPDIQVHFDHSYDDVSLELGAENGFRVNLMFDRKLDGSKTFWLMPWYEYWELGRSSDSVLSSNGVPVGTVFEPRSEMGNFGIGLGVRWLLE